MVTIFKYPFDIADEFTVRMPEGATLLSVQVQQGRPCMWAMVDTISNTVTRKFALRGTGHSCNALSSAATYVGTFQLNDGEFVGHLFDLGEQ